MIVLVDMAVVQVDLAVFHEGKGIADWPFQHEAPLLSTCSTIADFEVLRNVGSRDGLWDLIKIYAILTG